MSKAFTPCRHCVATDAPIIREGVVPYTIGGAKVLLCGYHAHQFRVLFADGVDAGVRDTLVRINNLYGRGAICAIFSDGRTVVRKQYSTEMPRYRILGDGRIVYRGVVRKIGFKVR